MDDHDQIISVRTLRDLRLLVTQTEEGLEEHVFSKLRIGDVWWIPDTVTGFADKQRHPWAIVRGYSARYPTVIASPRTTIRGSRGIMTPGGMLAGLDRPGIIVVGLRRTFRAKAFCGYEYAGRLPQEYIDEIEDYFLAFAKGKAKK